MNKAASNMQDKAAKRLAKRYRAERRFQLYGLFAILLATAFLLTLLGSIISTSLGAFTHHRLTLPVVLEADLVDPRGDLSADSLRRGSYNRVIQNALQAEFPETTDRNQLRELFGLYSAINAATLLNQVVDNPDLVGQTIELEFPLSDNVDLFLKDDAQLRTVQPVYAEINVQQDEDGISISAFEGVFSDFMAELADAARRRAEAFDDQVVLAERQLELTIDRNERETLLAEIERTRLRAERERDRANSQSGVELSSQTASLFLSHDGGIVRVNQINAIGAEARGELLLPFGSLNSSGATELWTVETPASVRTVTDRQIVWALSLLDDGRIEDRFNLLLFSNADSREPELAGVLGAVLGSILTMVITMFLAVPVGVSAAIYLEEFAPKNRITDFIEVNINNLAAVPSIVFGLLGLGIFINLFGLPRSAPLVGGMVLALMTLPTVIISSRAALKAVPDSIREAALGIGASKAQAVFHHVLPMALPGILTGSIIGLAQAFGETAPLLMIGMVAFIADPPSLSLSGFVEPATVMPVQIYIWSTSAERAFEARTAAAIMLLMTLILLFNAVAIYLRRRFERRW